VLEILHVGHKIADRKKNWHQRLARVNIRRAADRLCMAQAVGTSICRTAGRRVGGQLRGGGLMCDRNEA
jgi:hypothetical protein